MHLRTYSIALVMLLVMGGLAITLYLGFQIYRSLNPYLDYKVAGPVTISTAWVEIKPQEPLRPDRKVQYVIINIAEPMISGNPALEPTKEDGTKVRLEVQLVDQNGYTYNLNEPAGDGKAEIARGLGIDGSARLPKGTVFPVVRLRANTTVQCSSIIWQAYDPRDFK